MSGWKRSRGILLAAVLFVAAAALVVLTRVGGSYGALVEDPQTYEPELNLGSMDVSLTANGTPVGENDDLLESLVPQGEEFQVGKQYDEALVVTNSGDTSSYVRLTIHKYWDMSGVKATELDPELIHVELTGDGWVLDEDHQASPETAVYYYTLPLESGASAAELEGTIAVDGKLATYVSESVKDGTVTRTYVYDGVSFGVSVDVDSVQSHNAQDAILSAWGRAVEVSGDGVLSLR